MMEEPEPTRTTNGASRVALAVLVALAVVSPWMYGGVSYRATLAVSLLALVTPLAVLTVLARKGRSLPVPRAFWPGFAFLALGAAQLVPLPRAILTAAAPGSARVWYPADPAAAAVLGGGLRPISINPPATRRALALAGGLLALALLASPALARRRDAVATVLVVGGGALVLTLYALLARIMFGPRLYGVLAVPTVSPFGPFVSKNHFAGYVEMACLLVLGLAAGWGSALRRGASALAWIESRRASRVVLAAAAACTLALGVLASFSRGGAVSLAFGALLSALVNRWTARNRSTAGRLLVAIGLVALLGLALYLMLPSSGRERLRSLPQAADEGAGAFRLRIWRDSLRLAASSPLVGSGLGAFADALPYFKSGNGELRVENAENDYLQVLGEMGGLGFVCVVAALLFAFRDLVGGVRTQPDRVLRGLALGAVGALAALALHSAVDFNLRIPSNALLAAVLAAGAGGLAPSPRPSGRPALLSITLGLTAALSLITYDSVRTAATNEGRRPLRLGLRLAQTETALGETLERRPADAEAWVALGWVRSARGAWPEGAALARYGASLDPRRDALQAAAARIAASAPPGS